MAIGVLLLPFIPGEQPKNTEAFHIAIIVLCFIFIGTSCYLFSLVRKFPLFSIATDEDGLWFGHLDKSEALIPWKAIERIKESQIGQRLIVYGRGRPLIKIEYQLSDYNILRELILDKIVIDRNISEASEFSRKPRYHIGNFIVLIVSFGICGLAAQENIVYGILSSPLVIIFLHIYLTGPTKISIDEKAITILYPLKSKRQLISQIANIKITDEIVNHNQISICEIVLKNGRQIKIKNPGAGMDSLQLYKRLKELKGEIDT